MTTFSQFAYARPDMAAFQHDFAAALLAFGQAADAEACRQAFADINHLRDRFMSQYSICLIRHTLDTGDAFYEAENRFFDEQLPNYEALNQQFYQALIASPWRAALVAEWGEHLFKLAELSLKTFDPSIVEDLQQENRLKSDYVKLMASAKIELDGHTYNVSSIVPLEMATERAKRQRASAAKWQFYAGAAEQSEAIFEQLVQVRHRMARRLGYADFVGLGYARMSRSDYDAGMVARFRDAVAEHIVPIASRLYERQRQRLGLDALYFFDEALKFPDGNPQPQGHPDWIVAQAADMYRELSPETAEFFDYMQQGQLMDLLTKPNKAPGGYCTFINTEKAPFIFSNFNGTSGDIDVLTHEAGHAFQIYSSRHIGLNEYYWPTYEACEIHSMSMEFFAWPWMERFFGPHAARYRFAHLAGAIEFLPYGCAVDEFQHLIYAQPGMSRAERNATWRRLEQKYLPHRQYSGLPFLEQGGFWQRQRHIFENPFYYIDYVLAQFCAFQFWMRAQDDRAGAWADYVALCQAGGSRPFLDLVAYAKLRSPFEAGTIRDVAAAVSAWLDAESL